MYLKRLEVQGFKSFARRTEFHFDSGTTAIVGPNGSGKSNIADAIRWVLGEQSSRLLRTKKSEDVVFAGSFNRTPLGMAEVTLILDNSEGWMPLEFDEVAVTRRVYRSGDNEYMINKKRVRLKDVVDLLLRAGVGQGTYTVIGQGLVEAALSLRPEERRSLLEEAADVKRHYLKMAETSSRLEATLQNVTRLEDIVSEIRPRLTTLERQARQAAEYEKIAGELSDSLVIWHSISWYRINENVVKAQSAVGEKERLVVEHEARLAAATERLSSLRETERTEREKLSGLIAQRLSIVGQTERLSQSVSAREEQILSVKEQKKMVEKEIISLNDTIESERAHLAETIARLGKVQSEIVRLSAELFDVEKDVVETSPSINKLRLELEEAQRDSYSKNNKLLDAQRQLSELRKRAVAVQRESQSLDKEKETIEKEIARLGEARGNLQEELRLIETEIGNVLETSRDCRKSIEELSSAEATLEGKRVELLQERQRLVTRLDLLSKLRSGNQGVFGGVKAVLEVAEDAIGGQTHRKPGSVELHGIVGIVAKILRVPKNFEVAIEVALGTRVQDIVVEKWTDAEIAIEYLRRQNLGRATFLPMDTIKGARMAEVSAGNGVLGVAASLVKFEPRYETIINHLLGNTVITDDLPTARRLISQRLQASQLVTLAGDVVRTSGAVTGGSARVLNDTGLLSRERELRDLPREVATLDQGIARVIDALEKSRSRRRDLQAALQLASKEEAKLTENKNAKTNELLGMGHSIERLTQQISWQERLRQNAIAENDSVAEKENSIVSLLDTLASSDNESKKRITDLRAILTKAEEEIARSREHLSQTKTRLAVSERTKASETSLQGSYEASIRRLNQQIEDRRLRLLTLDGEETRIHQDSERAAQELVARRQERASLEDAIRASEEVLASFEENELAEQGQEKCERNRLIEIERDLAQRRLELQRGQDDLANLVARMEADGLLEAVLDDSQDTRSRLEDIPRQMGLRVGEGAAIEFPSQESLAQMEIDPDTLKRKIDRLRGQVRYIGSVNAGAIEEFEENRQRHEFLSAQITDMREAERTLRDGIESLEKIINEQFTEAFAKVAEEFSNYFSVLFGGGRAELVLTKPEDPAQTGLDIIAQPPGKRLQSLALLSGGERSLTAVALLFALLKVNPSPFCVLDEVDAALDEVNVTRFVEVLRRLTDRTQFIMITHNRASIEASDMLYGITMGTDGISRVISVRLDPERRAEKIGGLTLGGSVAG